MKLERWEKGTDKGFASSRLPSFAELQQRRALPREDAPSAGRNRQVSRFRLIGGMWRVHWIPVCKNADIACFVKHSATFKSIGATVLGLGDVHEHHYYIMHVGLV